MALLQPPSPQTLARAQAPYVGFQLSQGGAVVSHLILPLKPSQLILSQPSRVQTTQTIGGVFYDDFGFGVPTIQLSGHTGWYATTDGEFNGVTPLDGPTAYDHLYTDIYLKYFELEGTSGANGSGSVRLILHSTYENINYYVKPVGNFVLTRDRTNPMVFQYQVTFSVVQEVGGGNLYAQSSAQQSITGSFIDALVQPQPQQYETAISQAVQQSQGTTPTTPDPTGTSQTLTYTIQPGDTLSGIIMTYFGKVTQSMISQLAKLNGIANPNLIVAGAILKIPLTLAGQALLPNLPPPRLSPQSINQLLGGGSVGSFPPGTPVNIGTPAPAPWMPPLAPPGTGLLP